MILCQVCLETSTILGLLLRVSGPALIHNPAAKQFAKAKPVRCRTSLMPPNAGVRVEATEAG